MISSIVELEVLSPLFIKGKDVEYGEGFIAVNNKVYLIDNDKLCKFIGEKTYDENGIRRDSTPDYIQLYDHFITRPEKLGENDMLKHYKVFEESIGIIDTYPTQNDLNAYKIKSIDFFLSKTKLISGSEKDREKIIIKEKLAKGVTSLPKYDKKEFVKNGRDFCFIPGSTIKGAIRNAVLWQIMNDESHKIRFTDYVKNNLAKTVGMSNSQKKEYADDFSNHKVEEETLQSMSFTEKKPEWNNDCQVTRDTFQKIWQHTNEVLRDFLRIIKVSDANFSTEPALEKRDVAAFCKNDNNAITTFSIKIIKNKKGGERPVITCLQTIKKGTKARFKITIDDELAAVFFNSQPPVYLRSVNELLKIVNDFFAAIAVEEKDFYGAMDAAQQIEDVQNFYTTLFPSVNGTFRFRIGWGGGMKSKTQFFHLDEPIRSEVRNLIMHRGQQVAPKSRCLLIDDNNRPLKPLGWCSLRLLTGKEASYLGIDAYKQQIRGFPEISQPQGSVRAVIITTEKPVKVKILEGEFLGVETIMPDIQLRNLGLVTDSEVFVRIDKIKGKLIKVIYRGKA